MTTYDVPDEILVESEGPIRIITLNRPDDLNATNHVLHSGLAGLFPQIDADHEARVAVITGAGRAFCAGGDFSYIDELTRDTALRKQTLVDGKAIVTGMVRCRVPIVAAVNGPAVGLGCSLVALSDVVFMAESAHLADPHVLLGLVAADGGPVVWPLLTSLQLAKEYALTGDRIPPPGRRRSVWSTTFARTTRSWGRPGSAPGVSPACLRGRWRTRSGSSICISSAPCWPRSTMRSVPKTGPFTSPELRANLDRMMKRESPSAECDASSVRSQPSALR